MSTVPDSIKAAIDLANESYAAGYKEGYRAGQRDAIEHAVKLVQALPEKPTSDSASPSQEKP